MSEAIIEALRRRYMESVGNPARQLIGGGVRGYLGLDMPEYADQLGREAYANAQALGNAPGVGAPAGAFKAMAAAPLVVKALRNAPRSEALETARQNAVKMLGLPENNTAMDRARALGFDTPAYHGTTGNIEAFDNALLGQNTKAKSAQAAHFSVNRPQVASNYAMTAGPSLRNPDYAALLDRSSELQKRYMDLGAINTPEKRAALDEIIKERVVVDRQIKQLAKPFGTVVEKLPMGMEARLTPASGANVMPLMIRRGETFVKDYEGKHYRDEKYADVLKSAKKQKADSVTFQNTFDDPLGGMNSGIHDVYAVYDPSRIRSRFAAFDPARVKENDLLGAADPRLLGLIAAGTATGATVAALRNKKEDEKKKKRDE